MKKAVVVLVFFLIQNLLYAQTSISKGSVSLGGSISYSSTSFQNSPNAHRTFIFNPKAGYFFIDNFYTALSVSYINYKYGGSISEQYGIGPAIRYYFEAGIIKPFLGLGYNYLEHNSADSYKYLTNEFIITGGMDFFITPALALETMVNYSFMNYKVEESRLDPVESKTFRIEIGLNYFIY